MLTSHDILLRRIGPASFFAELDRLQLALLVFLVIVSLATAIYEARKIRGSLPVPYSIDRVKPLNARAIAQSEFKVYKDALDALCLGKGMQYGRLHVVSSSRPLAYLARLGWLPASGILINRRTAMVLSDELLEEDYTHQEIEAVMAVLLAKAVFVRMTVKSSWSRVENAAEEIGVNPSLMEDINEEFAPNWLLLLPIVEDTWAVRLTGLPGSLASAIKKSMEILGSHDVRERMGDPTVFVEPPHRADYLKSMAPRLIRFSGRGRMTEALHDLGEHRDRLLEFRLRNLGMIEQGMRQPGQVIEDGRLVTSPEGWE